eukprot:TRINITY_DN2111_c1_g1_i1.p1 TRINITY_DN2111_c1_g1~~TRINITY_DN2111_c1_g1_i1.p1  ORF type:complete len:152 (+),score=23.07 TRINITY_DN2111_c1_g1_i1:288-743(+)
MASVAKRLYLQVPYAFRELEGAYLLQKEVNEGLPMWCMPLYLGNLPSCLNRSVSARPCLLSSGGRWQLRPGIAAAWQARFAPHFGVFPTLASGWHLRAAPGEKALAGSIDVSELGSFVPLMDLRTWPPWICLLKIDSSLFTFWPWARHPEK